MLQVFDPCIASASQDRVRRDFHLDGRRVLVCTDHALDAFGAVPKEAGSSGFGAANGSVAPGLGVVFLEGPLPVSSLKERIGKFFCVFRDAKRDL